MLMWKYWKFYQFLQIVNEFHGISKIGLKRQTTLKLLVILKMVKTETHWWLDLQTLLFYYFSTQMHLVRTATEYLIAITEIDKDIPLRYKLQMRFIYLLPEKRICVTDWKDQRFSN